MLVFFKKSVGQINKFPAPRKDIKNRFAAINLQIINESIIFCILKNNVPLMPLRFNLIKLSLEKIYYWRTTTLFYYYYYYYYYIAN